MDIDPYSGLPFMEEGDPASSMAGTMESLVSGLYGPYSPPIVFDPAWVMASRGVESRILGNVLQWIDLTVNRAAGSATITAGSTGNISPTSLIGTLNNPADRPVISQLLRGHRPNTSTWSVRILENGEIRLVDGYPTASLAAGQGIRITGFYNKL